MRIIAHQAGNLRICGDCAFYGSGQFTRIGKAAAMEADIDPEFERAMHDTFRLFQTKRHGRSGSQPIMGTAD